MDICSLCSCMEFIVLFLYGYVNQRCELHFIFILKKSCKKSLKDRMNKPWDIEVCLCSNMDLTAKRDMTLGTLQHLLPRHWAKMELQEEQP